MENSGEKSNSNSGQKFQLILEHTGKWKGQLSFTYEGPLSYYVYRKTKKLHSNLHSLIAASDEVPPSRRNNEVNQLIDLFSFGNLSLQNCGEMMTVLTIDCSAKGDRQLVL